MNSSPNPSAEAPEPKPSPPQPEDRPVSSSDDSTMPTETSPTTDSGATAKPIAPVRPKRPTPPPPPPPKSEPEPQPAATTPPPSPTEAIPETEAADRNQPIPPPSEPMQYRAIGLVRGKYAPAEEQFTRGNLHADDGTAIDAVLLGRVMSLVKNHLDLQESHLWVVYPRTRKEDGNLHVQIVGVWEPENLSQEESDAEAEGEVDAAEPATDTDAEVAETATADSEESQEETSTDDASSQEVAAAKAEAEDDQSATVEQPAEKTPETATAAEVDETYFSIRGEIVSYEEEKEDVVVKIKQSSRKNGTTKIKFFKLNLKGKLAPGRSVGYFWDLQVNRVENDLVIQDSTSIAMIPPKRKRKGAKPYGKRRPGGGRGGPRRSPGGGKPYSAPRSSDRPSPKPVKRHEGGESSSSSS